MLINSAAHLRICPACGLHGKIVTATGESSIMFCSKEVAREALSAAAREGKIADDERLVVLSQIDESLLAEEECNATAQARTKTDFINALYEACLGEVEALPHSTYVN